MYHDHGHKNLEGIPRGKDTAGVVGFNYRMSDIHAALARSQLSRLDQFIKTRNEIAELYKKEFKSLPIKFQSINNEVKNQNTNLVT